MTTILVAIGRNVNGDPMPEHDWASFQWEARATVFTVTGGEVFGAAEGRGDWDGSGEDTAMLLGDVPAASLEGVKSRLRVLRHKYGQEAIGLVIHDDRHGESLV